MSEAEVWVADDNPAVSQSVVLLLLAHSMRARTMSSGAEVLRLLAQGERPSCLILDLKMPSNGGAVLAHIAADPSLTFPVVVVAGDPSWLPKSSADRAGAVLAKSGEPLELVGAVKTALAGAGGGAT